MCDCVPGDRLQHVYERDVAHGDDDESVDSRHCRDVQRNELTLRERELVAAAAVEEHVSRQCNCAEHGTALHDPLCAFLYREFMG